MRREIDRYLETRIDCENNAVFVLELHTLARPYRIEIEWLNHWIDAARSIEESTAIGRIRWQVCDRNVLDGMFDIKKVKSIEPLAGTVKVSSQYQCASIDRRIVDRASRPCRTYGDVVFTIWRTRQGINEFIQRSGGRTGIRD